MREKKKGTNECDKSTITCDVDTTQYKNGTIKCEKKIKEPLTKCDKSILTCNFGTTQYEDGTIKCEKK